MSPTAIMSLPTSTTAGIGEVDVDDFQRLQIDNLFDLAGTAVRNLDTVEVWNDSLRVRTGYLPFTKRSEAWTQSTVPAWTSTSLFDRLLEQITDTRTAGYLFGAPLPESVPAEWVAEVESYRSREIDGFVLPWNDDSDDDVGT